METFSPSIHHRLNDTHLNQEFFQNDLLAETPLPFDETSHYLDPTQVPPPTGTSYPNLPSPVIHGFNSGASVTGHDLAHATSRSHHHDHSQPDYHNPNYHLTVPLDMQNHNPRFLNYDEHSQHGQDLGTHAGNDYFEEENMYLEFINPSLRDMLKDILESEARNLFTGIPPGSVTNIQSRAKGFGHASEPHLNQLLKKYFLSKNDAPLHELGDFLSVYNTVLTDQHKEAKNLLGSFDEFIATYEEHVRSSADFRVKKKEDASNAENQVQRTENVTATPPTDAFSPTTEKPTVKQSTPKTKTTTQKTRSPKTPKASLKSGITKKTKEPKTPKQKAETKEKTPKNSTKKNAATTEATSESTTDNNNSNNNNNNNNANSGDQVKKKRRLNLPKQASRVLVTWLSNHLSHPYPNESQKLEIATETGLTIAQISNWFINARRRILVPMLNNARKTDPNIFPASRVASGHRNSFYNAQRSTGDTDSKDK